MIRLPSGEWVLQHAGTWGKWWGPWKTGLAYHRRAHIENCAVENDAFCHVDAIEDTGDGDNPPVP